MAAVARLPMCFMPWARPMVVVVLPSPSGVGVTAVTTTYLARGRSASASMASSETLATYRAVRVEEVLVDAHRCRHLGDRGQAWPGGRSRARSAA